MQLVTLDFETYYSKEFSLSKMTTEAYIRSPEFQIIGVAVKIGDTPAHWVSCATNAEYTQYLNFLNNDCMVLCHNTAFDGAILSWKLGIKPKFLLDTLSMARPFHGLTVGGSLKALAEHYEIGAKGTEVLDALGKRREDFTTSQLAQYGKYCENDVELTYKLFKLLGKDFPKSELRVIDLMLRMYTEPVVTLDAPLLHTHLEQVQARKQALLDKVSAVVGDLSLSSNNQFADVLRKLGIEPPMKTSPTTGKATYALSKKDVEFKELAEHPDERVQAVVAARLGTKSTQEETRTQSFLAVSKRGTLPIMLNYYGAHTGRASGGEGLNLQNLPSRDPKKLALRRSLRAPEGHVFVACDSSQIEARVVAYLAGQDDLVEQFRRGDDIYSSFASDVYGYPVNRKIEEIREDGSKYKPFKKEGDVGKTAILGLGFSMGADKFQHTLKVDAGIPMELDECKKVVEVYRTKFDRIKALWDESDKSLQALLRGGTYELGALALPCRDNKVYLPNGLFLYYPNLRVQDGQWADGRPKKEMIYDKRRGRGFETKYIYGGKGVENAVQALARIVVFDQMVEISRKYKVVLTVHDEVVACVPEDKAVAAEAYMTAVMSQAPKWAPNLPIACEASVGRTYADCK